jgi:PTH1 family peptidyl-tRNA hydrolase
LGNPGNEYVRTRHNLGFSVLDFLARQAKVDFVQENDVVAIALIHHADHVFLLAKPMTFINRSGIAVRMLAAQFNIPLEKFLIVYDDFHLPLGTLRFRRKGSAGGHLGLTSIIEQLDTREVQRLRLGIAGPDWPQFKEENDIVEYVLGQFDKREEKTTIDMITRAGKAVLEWCDHGIQSAMNDYNRSIHQNQIQIKP